MYGSTEESMQRLTSADKGRTDARLHLDTVRTLKQGYSRCTSLPHSTSHPSISAPEAAADISFLYVLHMVHNVSALVRQLFLVPATKKKRGLLVT